MKPKSTVATIEKLVCRHGDYFLVGYPTPYSRNGIRCTAGIYPRVTYEGPDKCLECHAKVGAYHTSHCSREQCAHCHRRLSACLGRKRGPLRNDTTQLTQHKR